MITLLLASLLSSIPVAIQQTEDDLALRHLELRVAELEQRVSELTKSRSHRVEWVAEAVAGKGFDWLTTGIALHRGAVEGNPALPTPEIRLGAGAIAIALQYALVELVNKLLGDQAAVWLSRGATAVYGGIGLHNLSTANRVRTR